MTLSVSELRGQRFDRSAEVRAGDDRTVEIAFASGEPVLRSFGYEVLDLARMDLSRLHGGAAVLVNHDPDRLVGVVLAACVARDGKARATVKLSRSALASEVWQDIQDGIRRLVSFGYEITDATADGERDGWPVYRVAAKPLELSFVSVPADATVGVGRSREDVTMSDISIKRDERDESERVKALYKMGAQYNQQELAQRAVDGNWSRERFQAAVLERMGEREVTTTPDLGLTEREAQAFSFVRLLRVLASPQDSKARKQAGFELAACAASERGEGYRIPAEVLNTGRRDLSFGSTQSGAKLVGTDHLGESFIELLRNRLVVREAGAQILDGLQGNIAIPRQSGAASWYWVAEGNAVTESTQTFDQVTASPRTGGTFTDISRRLLIQSSPAVENLVRTDLAAVAARGLDAAALSGNPAVTATAMSPRGVLYTSGVGSFSHGTNGGLASRESLVALWRAVAADNADMGSLAYITNTRVAATLANTPVDPGSGLFVYEGDGRLFNFPFLMSNAVPSNLSKGSGTSLSALFFGNWSDLMICLWSGLDILVDPYTNGTTGTVRIIALQDADIVVRHPESFAVSADCVTT